MDSDDAAGSRPKKLARYDHPNWAMLDCYLRPLRDGDTTTALAYASTGSGGKIGVGLVAAAPPRTSYLLYQWIPDEGRRCGGSSHKPTMIHRSWDAKAVAAHGNSILLHFLFPMNNGTFPGKSEEFFVYQALPRRTRRLTKLPTCRQNHTFMNRDTKMNTGILRRESGEFVVAHLTVLPGGRGDHRVTAELCCFFGNKGSWRRTECVPIICCDEAEQKHLGWWKTDVVLSFGDFICWVDYFRGILLCDVFSHHPVVKYVPLPVTPYHGNCNPHLRIRGAPATYRSVSVTNRGGGIKFVDIAPGDAWFCGGHGVARLPSHISSWTLTEEQLWVEDGVVSIKEVFGRAGLPSSPLECPLVDMIDPDTIYFVLGDDVQDDEQEEQELRDPYSQSCLIAVHMKSRTVDMISCDIRSFGSSDMYRNTTSCNLYFHEPFISLNLDVSH
ncbi:unnamed protein product [Urochloa decumbens]|uniref:DUF1618 domain-containing protein n=1 Tax=Urochloa decumbens TaxID=240449 RepID=A0ABC8Y3X1_9POAL